MKTLTADLKTYLKTEKNITSCDLYELRLYSGKSYYWTDTDQDILWNGKTWKHNRLMIKRQQVKLHSTISVDTLTVTIYADKNDAIESMPILKAAHSGVFDRSTMHLYRCYFRDRAVVGAVSLFGGNVEIKSAGGITVSLTIKAKTQGLNIQFPLRKYYPQGSYTTGDNGVISSTDSASSALIAPFVPRKEVLL